MALDLRALVDRYPVLWHVTTEDNYRRLERTRVLESAAALMRAASDERWLRTRRPSAVPLVVAGETVWLRDQGPLAEGAIAFEGGWTLPRLVEEINRRVYFWPGDARRPAARVRDNFNAFRRQPGAVALRLPLAAVASACRPFQLQVTAVNVGAPRASGGRRSPRGPRTFAAPGAFDGTPSDVREVTVLDSLALGPVWPSATAVSL